MPTDSKLEWNSRYPICEAGQQFIFACRRTAARLDLSEAEKLASYARMNLPAPLVEPHPVENVIALPAVRRDANAQSA